MRLPFTYPELVSGRKFDQFQSGLNGRFASLGYKLTYGEIATKPALWMDFDTDSAIGRVTLLESGECDMEVLDAESGGDLLRESHTFPDSDAFFDTYPKVPELVFTHTYGSRLEED